MKLLENVKRQWEGVTYYEMSRVVQGKKCTYVIAFTRIEIEVGRAYVAHRLRQSRAQLRAAIAAMEASA